MTIGKRIRKARLDAGLTQFKLATSSGYSLTSIQDWEAGRENPSRRAIKALEEALGATLAPDQGERREG